MAKRSNPAAYPQIDLKSDWSLLETKLLNHWYKSGIVHDYLHKNDSSDKYFSFMDGPITANNPMGVHHAWGRSYKDLWQRYKNMQGFRERFQNGFDCQGLWVEVEVEKELGLKNKKDIENLVPGNKKESIAKFINLCKERVIKYSQIQTEQTKRLGNFMDWENSYFTMSPENNYMIWHFLKKCHEKHLVYKGHDSVPWCPRCQTAISQHEMLTEDYKEAVHESVFFALPLLNKDFELLVWTTTPWTIPANVAVAVHPDFYYRVWKNEKTNKKYLILHADENKKVFDENIMDRLLSYGGAIKEFFLELKHDAGISDIQGKDLTNEKYKAAFDNLPAVQKASSENVGTFHTIVSAKDLVTPHEGTGLVHIAPGAGTEDFALSKTNNLPVIAPIDEEANYYEGFGDLGRQNAKKHPEIILDWLKKTNFFVGSHHYKHRYPACWRCKTELVWRVVDEWYIGMDHEFELDGGNTTLRKEMIKVAKKISWMPEFGLSRELDWLGNMHDWLISKKRYWGLALPIWECQKCNKFEIIGGEEELKEKAVRGFESLQGNTPHKPWIDDVTLECSMCKSEMHRIPDVGNPWLDAGIVPFSTIKSQNQGEPLYLTKPEEWKKWFPVEFITESFPGQFKNWFYSLIAMSTVLENTNPFKNVLGFGTLLAEDGRAMHKSWGNSIEFNEGADKIGADVMRFMFALANPSDNMLFGFKKADEVRNKIYLKIWNCYNYFAISSVAKEKSTDDSDSTNILDVWILERLSGLASDATHALESYDAQTYANSVETFIDDLSNWYIRRSRERLDPGHLTVLKEVLVNLMLLLAPVMPFISDSIFVKLTGKRSVHLEEWPKPIEAKAKTIEKMAHVRGMSELIHAERKKAGIPVRQPLASATLPSAIELEPEFVQLLKSEVNVKDILFTNDKELRSPLLDTNITEDLKNEGAARGIIREIQVQRKEMKVLLTSWVDVSVPVIPVGFESTIKKAARVRNISIGEFAVKKVHA